MQKFKAGDTVRTLIYSNNIWGLPPKGIPVGTTGTIIKTFTDFNNINWYTLEEFLSAPFSESELRIVSTSVLKPQLKTKSKEPRIDKPPTSVSGLDIEEKVSKSRDEFLRNTFT